MRRPPTVLLPVVSVPPCPDDNQWLSCGRGIHDWPTAISGSALDSADVARSARPYEPDALDVDEMPRSPGLRDCRTPKRCGTVAQFRERQPTAVYTTPESTGRSTPALPAPLRDQASNRAWRRIEMAWATAARVAWVLLSGFSIMKSSAMPS